MDPLGVTLVYWDSFKLEPQEKQEGWRLGEDDWERERERWRDRRYRRIERRQDSEGLRERERDGKAALKHIDVYRIT